MKSRSTTVLAWCVLSIVSLLPAAASAQPHTLYALVHDANTLLRFDSATPSVTEQLIVAGIPSAETLRGIDFRPSTGELYGVTDAAGSQIRVYVIDITTGQARTFGSPVTVTVPGTQWGMSFNPVADRIRLVNSVDENIRVNPNNYALSGDDPNLTSPTAPQPVVDAIAYDRQFPGATQTTLFAINRATSTLAYQGGLNGSGPNGPNGGVVTAVGPLGITLNATSPTGLDIATNGVMFAAMRPTAGLAALYTINQATGAATLVGAIGQGSQEIDALAVVDPSLAFSPGAGTYTTRQRFDLVLLVNLLGRGVVTGTATFDGIDVTAALASCVVPGLTSTGLVSLRCPALGGPVFSVGTHVLDMTLSLTDGSLIRKSVTWTIVAVTEP